MEEKILIIDFYGQYNQLIARYQIFQLFNDDGKIDGLSAKSTHQFSTYKGGIHQIYKSFKNFLIELKVSPAMEILPGVDSPPTSESYALWNVDSGYSSISWGLSWNSRDTI